MMVKGDAGTGKTTMGLQIIESLSDKQPEYYLSSRVSDVALFNQFPWLKERVRNNELLRAGKAFLRRDSERGTTRSRPNAIVDTEPVISRKELNRLEGQIEAGELGFEDEETSVMEPDGTVVVELGSMMPEIEMAYDIVESNLPKKTLVVLDSVEALAEMYGIPANRIVNALQRDLVEKAGTNVIFIMETADRNHLDYLGDGVIIMRNTIINDHRVRTIDIDKLRGTEIRNWRYLFTLNGGRVTVMERDHDIASIKMTPSQTPVAAGRGSLGWSEMDRLFGGAPLGSMTLLEVDQGVPMDLLDKMELALISEHLRAGKGILWYPERTLDYTNLTEQLGFSKNMGAMDRLRVLDASGVVDSGYNFIKKLEGEELDHDLHWDTLRYMLRGTGTPYLSLMGLDALESIYGTDVAPKLLQHVDAMRRGGHMVVVESTYGSKSLETVAHQARLHLCLMNLNGTVVLHSKKPTSIYYCFSIENGEGKWVPML